jgi:hypothetical protein
MILILEQDTRSHDGSAWTWKPGWLRRPCGDSRFTWRVWWGLWSLSYYPHRGLKDFGDWMKKDAAWVVHPDPTKYGGN